MAKDVSDGLALDSSKGAAVSWAYMKYCKVPQQVILRVLAEPKLRRYTGWHGMQSGPIDDAEETVIRL